jgi:hypothetical protein
MTNQNNSDTDNQEDELNLIEIYNQLIIKKTVIFTVTSLFFLAGVIYSLLLPTIYTSNSQLTSVSSSGQTSGPSSQLGGLAAIAGLNLGTAGGDKATISVETIKSRDFFRHLITFENIPQLLYAPIYDSNSKQTFIDPAAYDVLKKQWLIDEPSFLNLYFQYRAMMTVYQDKRGFVYISVAHQSPVFAAEFLTLIIDEVNNLTRIRDLEESQSSLNYLYNQLGNTQVSDIRVAINQLIESQLKKQMLANVKKYYTLQPLDTAYIPEIKTSPQRRNITILFSIAGFLLSLLFILARFYLFSKK